MLRELTDNPFDVNLIPSATDTTLFTEELEAYIESGIDTVVFFWDVSPETIACAKPGERVSTMVQEARAVLESLSARHSI